MKQIIADKYKDLEKFLNKSKIHYQEAKPFPFIEIDNFFDEKFLDDVLQSFPKLSEKKHNHNMNIPTEVKLGINSPELIPDKINEFIEYLNSYFFLNFLQKLTGINESLIPDPYLFGGGLHEIKKGGFLKIHSDFNVHPQLSLNRRINLLLYLNKSWNEEWGGHLELWDRNMKKCGAKISPTFNKLVIFNTTDFSFHGHPEPLKCPDNVTRKSLALYYYTNGRPKNEINFDHGESGQTTLFQKREGSEDNFSTNRIKFKKIFGKFYIRTKEKY
tara:strand:- start:265 stop:1083 length:819 start_codon:yes stop_codon:yes gene_type:complete